MTTWRKSSYSGSEANCVQVGTTRPGVLVRDTKDRGHGPELTVPASDWQRFLTAIRANRAVR